MIKKVKFGNTNNVTLVEFGNGSVSFRGGYEKEGQSKFLLFKEGPPGNIGIERNKTIEAGADEFEPEIAFKFKNRESFDVFFDLLTIMKNEYLKDDMNKKSS